MYAMGGGRGVSRQAPAPRTGRAGACGVFERHAGGRRQEYNRRMTAKRFNDPIEPMPRSGGHEHPRQAGRA